MLQIFPDASAIADYLSGTLIQKVASKPDAGRV